MTTLERTQTAAAVDQINLQIDVAHDAMNHADWTEASDRLHTVMRKLHDATMLRAYVETAWTEVDSPYTSVMMFQESPPRFRIDLMMQLARGAAAQIDRGAHDRAARELEQLQVILELLQRRLAA